MRRTSRTMIATAVVAALGLLTGHPAGALVQSAAGAGPVGTMRVGSVATPIPLPHTGECTVTGKGLQNLGAHGAHKQKDPTTQFVVNKQLYYRLTFTGQRMTLVDGQNPGDTGPYEYTLNLCGIIGPGRGGNGAACNVTSGKKGRGRLRAENLDNGNIKLFDVQNFRWDAQNGPAVKVKADIKQVNTAKTTRFTDIGKLHGTLTIHWDLSCQNPKKDPGRGGGTLFGADIAFKFSALQHPPGGAPNTPKLTK